MGKSIDRCLVLALLFGALLAGAPSAWAHAVAGMRVFPATLSFDDPGAANEFGINDGQIKSGSVTTNTLSLAYSKTITPSFALSVASDYNWVAQPGAARQSGWDNLAVGAAYQLFINGPHEAIGLLAVSDSLANTGSGGIGSNFSTVSPEFAFGKGMGDLPQALRFLHPFAVTGAVSEDFPDTSSQPRMFNGGLSLQYSIPYLQSFVKYLGLGAPFSNMVPLVEYTVSKCVDSDALCRSTGNQDTTGFINPGVIWLGRYYQVGIEAQIPVNRASGNHVGVLVGLDVYLDDVLPHSLGAPIWR